MSCKRIYPNKDPESFKIYKIHLLAFILLAMVLSFLLASDPSSNPPNIKRSPVFPLQNKFKGVCWTGERRKLEKGAIDRVKTYGVEWISQTPFGWMKTPRTPRLHFSSHHGWWGETDEGIRVTTRRARQKGIKVMLKPHLWITRPSVNGWRNDIDFRTEADWQQWEAGYTRFMLHHARLAAQENIEMLCIGAELTHSVIKRPEYWKSLIHKIRKIYPGKLTYAANWYREYDMTSIWRDLDYIGIQCYFPLTEKERPTVAELVKGWQPHVRAIEAVAKKFAKPVILAEVGYTNTLGAAVKPWQWSQRISRDRLDHAQQVNAYEALFRVFGNKDWLAGIFIWKWYPSHHRVRADRVDFSPQNKPAAQVLKKWYTYK